MFAIMTRCADLVKRTRRLANGEGFSLTEVLMASMLLLVILAAVYGIWFGMQRTYMFAEEDMTAQQEARTAMNEMVELIRTAREPDATFSEEQQSLDMVIVRAEPNLIVVWTDADRDADHDLELVCFQADPATKSLLRYTSQDAVDPAALGDPSTWDDAPVRLVGSYVSNDDVTEGNNLFSYYDMNSELDLSGGKVEDPTQIREVHIKLLVDVVIGEAPASHELTSVVQPRNLRTY